MATNLQTLKIFVTHPNIVLPKFATDQAACFDIAFQGHGKHEYQGYNSVNKHFTRPTPDGRIFVNAGERVMVPTGLIFDIPVGYSVRLHARSSTSYRQGLVLANSEAIIDSDYVEEVKVLLYNRSGVGVWINNGDRIAQAEMIKSIKYSIEKTDIAPELKGNRVGGIGSTGVSS